MMNQMKIGPFISERRKAKGWTQSQLAEKLEITDKAVSKWETGRSMPDLALFIPLCTLLDVTLNELFAGECIAEEKLKGKADLVEYIDTFMLKQRAKEFASYLLLGMEKRRLTRLFLCEVLLIGFCCYITGTTIGFFIYGFWYFREPLHEMKHCGFLYGKSMLYTFLFFCRKFILFIPYLLQQSLC